MENAKVILVDGNVFFRNGLQTILKNLGHADIIGVAADGEEFLAMLDSCTPDVVFLDIKIPKMNGYEITKLALKKEPGITIVAYSLYEENCFISKMLESGAKGYLSKCRNNIEIIERILSNWKEGYFFSKEIETEFLHR